ncbi:MAG: hypothetical protein K6F56_08625, partial [Oscillospiraceae bacterium]|nr:hypothetical protein [Oscillospiraceae bacterium]
MKNKRIFCLLLAAVMMFGLCACGAKAETKTEPTAAPQPAAEPQEAAAAPSTVLSDIDQQLVLIHSKIDELMQKGGELPWYYAVTDLDHDGAIEFIAASQHPKDRSTNLKLWTVNADRSALTECKVQKDEEESFPDIMTDSADTYHVTTSNTWYYMFYDNVVISDTEVYTSKSAFDLKNGAIAYEAYAVEHSVVENGVRTTTHTDMNGADISLGQYNAAGTSAFANAEKSSTSFEWLTADEVGDLKKLTDSLLVFMGMKKPTETFPVPQPAAMQAPEATPAPS